MTEKRFNLRTVPEKWKLSMEQLLKRTKNNYLLQTQKNSMNSVFVALGNIQATEQNRPSI